MSDLGADDLSRARAELGEKKAAPSAKKPVARTRKKAETVSAGPTETKAAPKPVTKPVTKAVTKTAPKVENPGSGTIGRASRRFACDSSPRESRRSH